MLAHGALLFVASIAGLVQAGNTACKTTSLDWYTQSVGETPCRTYERLRQNCNPSYQVGNLAPTTPGDVCDTSFRKCCCNAVAWSLSMLCLNCQYGGGAGGPGHTGIDAPDGSYGKYLNNCRGPTNRGLPDDVQNAVCQNNIKLPAILYGGTWDGGDWYYGDFSGRAYLEISQGKNESSPRPSCPTPSSTSTGTSTIIPISQPSSTESRIPVGVIAGGVAGGVVLLSAVVLLGCWIRRKRRERGVVDLIEESKILGEDFEPYRSTPRSPDWSATITPYPGPPSSPDGTNATEPSQSTQASVPRHNKPGLIASNSPNRAELQPLNSTEEGYSEYLAERHEDSGALTNAFGLGRSASGRLPPSYQLQVRD